VRREKSFEQKSLRVSITALPDGKAVFLFSDSWCEHPHITTMSAVIIDKPVLSIRTTSKNAFHHLWNNNGTWWVHYTEHLPDHTKRRVRRSLHTADSGIARVLRDSLLCEAAHFEEEVTREH
jgi:hypothetical protein